VIDRSSANAQAGEAQAGATQVSRASAQDIAGAEELAAAGKTQSDLDRLAWLLDSSIRLPGGFRVGLDGLIGLIPGFGDAVGALISLYVVRRASALGLPKPVLARMLLNVGLEAVVGAIPILGDLFDFAFKANQRNVALARRYAVDARREQRVSGLLLIGFALVLIVLAAMVVALGVLIAQWLASLF
jgi:hypothetical protein